jgi:hypothetical protein
MKSLDLFTLVTLTIGALYLLGAGFVFWRRRTYPQAARVMLVFLVFSSLLALFQGLEHAGWLDFIDQRVLERVPPYGVLLLGMVFLALTRAFLRTEGTGWVWWLIGVVWMAAVVALDANLFALPEQVEEWADNQLGVQTIASIGQIAGWAVFMGGATVYTARILKRYSRYYTAVT